ncbi:hypothetical protein [Scytonema sp. PCC 10023]|uniref:hypothetical protein n=1 Tax=Scytonema sp. PCC 10023 TaxID=1680591 RepID=UPI0039C5DE07
MFTTKSEMPTAGYAYALYRRTYIKQHLGGNSPPVIAARLNAGKHYKGQKYLSPDSATPNCPGI